MVAAEIIPGMHWTNLLRPSCTAERRKRQGCETTCRTTEALNLMMVRRTEGNGVTDGFKKRTFMDTIRYHWQLHSYNIMLC